MKQDVLSFDGFSAPCARLLLARLPVLIHWDNFMPRTTAILKLLEIIEKKKKYKQQQVLLIKRVPSMKNSWPGFLHKSDLY
jgi:hypothetical protein